MIRELVTVDRRRLLREERLGYRVATARRAVAAGLRDHVQVQPVGLIVEA